MDMSKYYEVGQGKGAEYVKGLVKARRIAAVYLKNQSRIAKSQISLNNKIVGWVVYNEVSKQYAWVVKKPRGNVFYHMTKDGKLGKKF